MPPTVPYGRPRDRRTRITRRDGGDHEEATRAVRVQWPKSLKIERGNRKRERDECESSEDQDFDSATTDARESVESAEDGGKPSS